MLAFLVLIGYLYNVEQFHHLGQYSSMAIHSALNFVFLALGIWFVRPQKGWMTLLSSKSVEGVMVRRLLPTVFGVPTILGWLCLWGASQGFYTPTYAFALMVI